jgi:hypothetical protein
MEGTGEHHLKWIYPVLEVQKPHVFSHIEYDCIQIKQHYGKQITANGEVTEDGGV